MKWWTLLLAALVAMLVACGEDKSEADIRDTIEGFYQALSNDPPTAYTYLAQECKDDIKFIEFATSLTFFEGFLGESELKATNVNIVDREDDELDANFTVVLLANDEEIPLSEEVNDEGPTTFVKEDGRWRFADCAGFGAVDDAAPTPAAGPNAWLIVAWAAEADNEPLLPGDYVDLPALYGGPYPDTAPHVQRDVNYVAHGNSNPPAGGPHWGSGPCPPDPVNAPPFCGPVPWGIYREAWQAGNLVHNMEHSGVVLWYNTTDQAIIDELEDLLVQRLNAGKLLVMTPYPDMEAEQIAITSWSRIDKFSVGEYRRERVEEFIDAHERRFNPEDF